MMTKSKVTFNCLILDFHKAELERGIDVVPPLFHFFPVSLTHFF